MGPRPHPSSATRVRRCRDHPAALAGWTHRRGGRRGRSRHRGRRPARAAHTRRPGRTPCTCCRRCGS
eukprot:14819817-Heterocapsa_arctica.AAC.1